MTHFQVRKNDFIRHIKQLNIGDQFNALDNDSDQYWHNVAVTAFKFVQSALGTLRCNIH